MVPGLLATRIMSGNIVGIIFEGLAQDKCEHRGRRGAPLARREKDAYWLYATDEEHRQRGWIGGRMQELFCAGHLGAWFDFASLHRQTRKAAPDTAGCTLPHMFRSDCGC